MFWGPYSVIPPLFARRGLAGTMALLAVLLIRGFHSFSFYNFRLLCTGLPTLAATLCIAGRRGSPFWYLFTWWPLAATFFFYTHPATSLALFYPLCWFTLPLLHFLPRIWQESQIIAMWRGSITAHTVGTLLVLYSGPTEAVFWQSLQYFVPLERAVIAVGMLAVAYIDHVIAVARGTHTQE